MWSLSTIFLFFVVFRNVFGLETALNKEIRDRMLSVLDGSQKKNGLFGDFHQTLHAIKSYKLASRPVPNTSKLCKSLSGIVKKAKNLESLAQVYMSIAELKCKGQTVPTDVLAKFKAGLKSDKVSNLYHTTQAVYSLADAGMVSIDKFDMGSVLGNIEASKGKTLFKESSKDSGEGSPYKTALVLKIAAGIYDNIPSEKESSWKFLTKVGQSVADGILKKAKKFDEMMFWQDSLTATTAVLESFIHVKKILKDGISIPVEVYDRVAPYILLNKGAKSIGAIANVLLGATLLRDVETHRPLFQIYKSPFCLAGADSHLLTLHVTDIWGEPVTVENVIMNKPYELSFAQGSNGAYTADIGPELKKLSGPSILETEVTVNLKERDPVMLSSRLVHGVEFKTGQVRISNMKGTTGTEKKESKVSYPKSSGKTYKVNGKMKVRMEYKFPDLGITPEQVFVLLTDKNGVFKSVGASSKVKGTKFTSVIDVKKDPFNKLESGVYDLSIIIGDTLLMKSVSWKVAAVNVTKPPPAKRRGDYEPVNDDTVRFENQEPIEHTFAEPERRPPAVISLAFAALTLLPLGGLLWGVFNVLELRVTLPTGQARIVSILFQVSLIVIAFWITAFWVKVGIFQSLGCISVTMVAASVLGYKTLKYRLLEHS